MPFEFELEETKQVNSDYSNVSVCLSEIFWPLGLGVTSAEVDLHFVTNGDVTRKGFFQLSFLFLPRNLLIE